MTDVQTSDVSATLAPINTGPCNDVWQLMFDKQATFKGTLFFRMYSNSMAAMCFSFMATNLTTRAT
jgi:hypothetical protein